MLHKLLSLQLHLTWFCGQNIVSSFGTSLLLRPRRFSLELASSERQAKKESLMYYCYFFLLPAAELGFLLPSHISWLGHVTFVQVALFHLSLFYCIVPIGQYDTFYGKCPTLIHSYADSHFWIQFTIYKKKSKFWHNLWMRSSKIIKLSDKVLAIISAVNGRLLCWCNVIQLM